MELKTKESHENILKYYNTLKKLKLILDNTNKITMMNFCTKNNVSEKLSQVLQKGGIIKMTKKGRFPEWEWTSIEPTREMAIKTLNQLSLLTSITEDRRKYNGGKRVGAGRKSKSLENMILESKTISLGFIKIKIKYNYK